LKPSGRLSPEIDLAALRANFRALRAVVPHGELMVVVKADAYWHGAFAAAVHPSTNWLG
jgi:alanine racemase